MFQGVRVLNSLNCPKCSPFITHNCVAYHIWNSDETCIQVGRQLGAKVFIIQGSHQVYNIIPKYREWLIINYVVNVAGITLLRFYVFK
jgi:hypothetical protein